MSNVTDIPISTWQRILNRRGKRTVNCIVSGRYFRYGSAESAALNIGTPVSIDVMTDTDRDMPDRKLCTMFVTVEQLRNMLETLENDLLKDE